MIIAIYSKAPGLSAAPGVYNMHFFALPLCRAKRVVHGSILVDRRRTCCTYLSSGSPETLLARFIIPERFAVPQLGRLRELLLREARLLDTLSHGCIVPLESGWLEQRTGFEDPHVCACNICCSYPSRGRARNRAVGEESESAPAEESGSGEEVLDNSGCQHRYRGDSSSDAPEGGCWRQPGALALAAMGSAFCRDRSSNVRLSVSGEDRSHGDTDVAALLLRSWVPLTLEDVDSDDNDAHQNDRGEQAHSNKDISNGGSINSPQCGGLEQLRWGGDDKTDWRGTAEPKSPAYRTTSTARTPVAEKPLDRKAPDNFAATSEFCLSCAYRGRVSTNDVGGGEFPLRRRRTLSLASYLLLPDWLPLAVWFETEFEPRTASSDEQGGAVTTRVVTTPDNWALVWRHLLSMFVQVRSCSLSVEGICASTRRRVQRVPWC